MRRSRWSLSRCFVLSGHCVGDNQTLDELYATNLTLHLNIMQKSGLISQKLGISGHAAPNSLDSFLFLLSALIPAAYLTVRGLLGSAGILLLLTSTMILWREQSVRTQLAKIRNLRLILVSMALPTVALLIADPLRLDIHLRDFDGPSRMLLVIPIFFAFYVRKIDFSKAILLALPLGLITIFLYAIISHHEYAGNRLTVAHMNPILWGDTAMVLGFMCLFSIQPADSIAKKAYLAIGLLVGVVMSILSQSRGGWVAGGALFLLWIWLHRKAMPPFRVAAILIGCTVAFVGLYQFSGIVHYRVDTAINGVHGWMTGRDPDSPTGYRLTMWKIGLYLFLKHPLLGYGDHQLSPYLNSPYIKSFADPVSIHGIQCCGPHNEIIAQLLRSGIFGILSLAGTYFIPLYFFGKALIRSAGKNVAASQAICLIVGYFVSALTIEMLTLKVAWTFYALFMAGLMSNVEWRTQHDEPEISTSFQN
ncbi:MAG: O-antigen ligase family protein [Acidiferrobacterales bacterium]